MPLGADVVRSALDLDVLGRVDREADPLDPVLAVVDLVVLSGVNAAEVVDRARLAGDGVDLLRRRAAGDHDIVEARVLFHRAAKIGPRGGGRHGFLCFVRKRHDGEGSGGNDRRRGARAVLGNDRQQSPDEHHDDSGRYQAFLCQHHAPIFAVP